MYRMIRAGCFVVAATLLAGCEKKPAPTEFKGKNEGHGHEHNRKDAMIEDADLPDGAKCHAGLTAHLSEKEGNELDVFFERHDKEESFAIPMKAKVTAVATRPGDKVRHDLTFLPSPKDERKGDPDDRCSRYTAEAKWMKPDDKLAVVLTVEIDGKIKKTTFSDFVPKENAHHHD